MKLIVCATWPGCSKSETNSHLGEVVVLDTTPQEMNQAMNTPRTLWSKRQFVCERCGETAIVAPTGTYLSE